MQMKRHVASDVPRFFVFGGLQIDDALKAAWHWFKKTMKMQPVQLMTMRIHMYCHIACAVTKCQKHGLPQNAPANGEAKH